MREQEYCYRQLYYNYTKAYETPVGSWQELADRYPTAIPEQPPSIIDDFLTEQYFFPLNGIEVYCLKNLRYCPGFLHRLEFIKIVYVLRGSAWFFVAGEQYELQAGQFCIVAPGMEQAIFSCRDEDIVLNILLRTSTFSNSFSALLMERNIISDFFWRMSYTRYSNQVLYFACEQDSVLEQTVLKIYDEIYVQPNPSNLLLKSYVMIFLGESLRSHRESLIRLEGNENKTYRIPTILQDVKQNLGTITLGELAAKWNMSEISMNHYLKIETGYSFSYLLLDMRIRHGADMLMGTKKSVEQIMEECGIGDIPFFYRHFKKKYGMTPQQYRLYGRLKG